MGGEKKTRSYSTFRPSRWNVGKRDEDKLAIVLQRSQQTLVDAASGHVRNAAALVDATMEDRETANDLRIGGREAQF